MTPSETGQRMAVSLEGIGLSAAELPRWDVMAGISSAQSALFKIRRCDAGVHAWVAWSQKEAQGLPKVDLRPRKLSDIFIYSSWPF